jgi:rifampicin phosphotransferase
MSEVLPFDRVGPADGPLVGGKGLSLALTAQAGLPVPPGFCISTAAYRRCARMTSVDSTLTYALAVAYRELGRGVVAVRSSASAEDGSIASFAGQQETILGVDGLENVIAAVERCWQSLHTERARAYREHQRVDTSSLAMAVVVQRLVDADVAGVLFTRDPLDDTGKLMRVEAAWGLGEAVVSGRVTPDRFQVERETGMVRDRQPGDKPIRISASGEGAVSGDQRLRLCLTDDQLAQLAGLGRRVEAYFGDARDVEWAIADGQVWLLQARPITAAGAAERELVRRENIERLEAIVEPGGTVWSRTNLIEVLREPTPMTWALVSGRLLAGGGGTGAMYRDFGFRPDPALWDKSGYDLIGGRPYLNLSREPRLESTRPLAGYPLAKYKDAPHLALDPKRENPRGLRKWLGLFGLIRVAARIMAASKSFADELRQTHIPAFAAEVERARTEDLSQLDAPGLRARFEAWADRTLVQFARHSLKPTLLAQFSWQVLEQQLGKPLGPERARAVLTELSQGARPDPEADLPGAIRDLAAGKLSRDEFLRRFGHRGPDEMELSSPRWAEDPSPLDKLSAVAPLDPPPSAGDVLARVTGEAKWNSAFAKSMAVHVERLRTYLGLRETAKHYLMQGYAELRRILLELDRRFGLNGGIFFLTPADLPDLIEGDDDLPRVITEHRKTRAIELSLEVPPVVFGDDLEAVGRPLPPPEGAEQLVGIPLSAGVAEGPALVLAEPSTGRTESGYILVCPSTDPAWVPLFVNARGLVMETGGTLSHGAIVAREFRLPAVAGLPGVQHRLRTGQLLRVDGARGLVSVIR